MTRLIDADALKREQMKAFNCESATKYGNKDAKQQEHSYSTIMLYEVSDIIEDTIDNAPTVEERPHGKWIEKVERRGCFAGDKTVYSYTCPFCGVKEFKKYPFCHCGADMRKEADDDKTN